jgi:protein SCO1/2
MACAPAASAAPLGKVITAQGETGFTLQDTHGRPTRLGDFHGRVVALVFGYTQCPDYCPTTLARLAGITRLVGDSAGFVPVFVTLDPERDTLPILAAYTAAFHPDLRGLRGDLSQTAAAAHAFRVLFEKAEDGHGGYTVDHSGGIFLVDRKGALRLKEEDRLDVQDIARDIRSLLQE